MPSRACAAPVLAWAPATMSPVLGTAVLGTGTAHPPLASACASGETLPPSVRGRLVRQGSARRLRDERGGVLGLGPDLAGCGGPQLLRHPHGPPEGRAHQRGRGGALLWDVPRLDPGLWDSPSHFHPRRTSPGCGAGLCHLRHLRADQLAGDSRLARRTGLARRAQGRRAHRLHLMGRAQGLRGPAPSPRRNRHPDVR